MAKVEEKAGLAALEDRRTPWAPWSQEAIDLVRIRVMGVIVAQAVAKGWESTVKGVRHLWFPEPNTQNRLLRDGNPPADCDRPKHLRGMNLVIDLDDIPPEVWDSAREKLAAHIKSKYRLVVSATDAIIKPTEGDGLIIPAHELPRA